MSMTVVGTLESSSSDDTQQILFVCYNLSELIAPPPCFMSAITAQKKHH